MNKDRMEELAQAVERSETFDQRKWYNACGTPACVAGHAVFLWPEEVTLRLLQDNGTESPISLNAAITFLKDGGSPMRIQGWDDEAQKILDLTPKQADDLFTGTPRFARIDFGREVMHVSSEHAAYTIRHVANEGRGHVNWQAYGRDVHGIKPVKVTY